MKFIKLQQQFQLSNNPPRREMANRLMCLDSDSYIMPFSELIKGYSRSEGGDSFIDFESGSPLIKKLKTASVAIEKEVRDACKAFISKPVNSWSRKEHLFFEKSLAISVSDNIEKIPELSEYRPTLDDAESMKRSDFKHYAEKDVADVGLTDNKTRYVCDEMSLVEGSLNAIISKKIRGDNFEYLLVSDDAHLKVGNGYISHAFIVTPTGSIIESTVDKSTEASNPAYIREHLFTANNAKGYDSKKYAAGMPAISDDKVIFPPGSNIYTYQLAKPRYEIIKKYKHLEDINTDDSIAISGTNIYSAFNEEERNKLTKPHKGSLANFFDFEKERSAEIFRDIEFASELKFRVIDTLLYNKLTHENNKDLLESRNKFKANYSKLLKDGIDGNLEGTDKKLYDIFFDIAYRTNGFNDENNNLLELQNVRKAGEIINKILEDSKIDKNDNKFIAQINGPQAYGFSGFKVIVDEKEQKLTVHVDSDYDGETDLTNFEFFAKKKTQQNIPSK